MLPPDERKLCRSDAVVPATELRFTLQAQRPRPPTASFKAHMRPELSRNNPLPRARCTLAHLEKVPADLTCRVQWPLGSLLSRTRSALVLLPLLLPTFSNVPCT